MPTANTDNDEIEWSYDEVTAELKRMGLPSSYPPTEDFTESEITDAIGRLSDYYLTSTVAEYNGAEFTSQQVKTWAAFVDTLGKDARIVVGGGEFRVTRDTSDKERRASALSQLANERMIENRSYAKRELTRRYREEKTDAAGFSYDNGLTS